MKTHSKAVEDIFQFRHFAVRDENAAMKVGTDSVLLGSFCRPAQAKTILDVGTGTGILALMLAQKSDAIIDAVELDKDACIDALENFRRSEWLSKLNLRTMPLKDFQGKNYDIIISNPPYFQTHSNVVIRDSARRKARHEEELTLENLCTEVNKRLAVDGAFWVIIPFSEKDRLKRAIELEGMNVNEEIHIRPKPSKPMNRIILKIGKLEQNFQQHSFTIYTDDGKPTEEYMSLTKEYYLWKGLDDDPRLKI